MGDAAPGKKKVLVHSLSYCTVFQHGINKLMSVRGVAKCIVWHRNCY